MALNLEQEIQQDIQSDADSALENLWNVIIHNDEVTPYDFVIMVLQKFFQLLPPDAEYITFVAHTSGKALVATLSLKEAQKRVGQAHFAASLEGYPLTFTIEPE